MVNCRTSTKYENNKLKMNLQLKCDKTGTIRKYKVRLLPKSMQKNSGKITMRINEPVLYLTNQFCNQLHNYKIVINSSNTPKSKINTSILTQRSYMENMKRSYTRYKNQKIS